MEKRYTLLRRAARGAAKAAVAIAVALAPECAWAQPFTGVHEYDGEHRNELTGYTMGGYNIVSGAFGGFAASYKRHLTDHWNVEGAVQVQAGKQLYSAYAKGGYRLKWGFSNFYFDGKMMVNRYHRFGTNEMSGNISAVWETPYFFLHVGESYIHYHVLHNEYTEPLTFTFGTGVNIRPRWNSWNIGLFFRNYDEFYYENWNINWGINFNASLCRQAKLFGEFNVRPAGSMSQLASRYETSGKLGIKYVW